MMNNISAFKSFICQVSHKFLNKLQGAFFPFRVNVVINYIIYTHYNDKYTTYHSLFVICLLKMLRFRWIYIFSLSLSNSSGVINILVLKLFAFRKLINFVSIDKKYIPLKSAIEYKRLSMTSL